MRHEEIDRDLDQAIARLTDAKARVQAIAAENDLGELRKMAAVVTDFQVWAAKLPEPEVVTPEVATAESFQKEDSEVAGMTVDEAKDIISRMRSTEKLEHILATDNRKGVQEAVHKRMDELQSNA